MGMGPLQACMCRFVSAEREVLDYYEVLRAWTVSLAWTINVRWCGSERYKRRSIQQATSTVETWQRRSTY